MVFSWELNYHARFISMDTVLTHVIALQLFLLTRASFARTPTSFLLLYASASALGGLAFSCKITGLVAALPPALFPFLMPRPTPVRRRIGLCALGALVGGVTGLLLQPGLLIDLPRFIATQGSLTYQYSHGDSPNITATFFERLRKFLAWLWLAVPSHYLIAAIVMSAVALYGLGSCFAGSAACSRWAPPRPGR